MTDVDRRQRSQRYAAKAISLMAARQEEICAEIGAARGAVSTWKCGKRAPSRRSLRKLAMVAKARATALSDLAAEIEGYVNPVRSQVRFVGEDKNPPARREVPEEPVQRDEQVEQAPPDDTGGDDVTSADDVEPEEASKDPPGVTRSPTAFCRCCGADLRRRGVGLFRPCPRCLTVPLQPQTD